MQMVSGDLYLYWTKRDVLCTGAKLC